MHRTQLRSGLKPARAAPVRRIPAPAPYNRDLRPSRRNPGSPPSTDSGNHSSERELRLMKAAAGVAAGHDRRLIPTLNDVGTQLAQVSSGVEEAFLAFMEAAHVRLLELSAENEALRTRTLIIAELEAQVGRLKRQMAEVRRNFDDEKRSRIRAEKELAKTQTVVRKVGSYLSKNGADPKCISESSSDDVPRQELDNFLGRLYAKTIVENVADVDGNSTRDSILLSGAEETGSEEPSRYDLRGGVGGRRSRGSRGRRSKSVVVERSRSRSRHRRRSSTDASKGRAAAAVPDIDEEKENVIVASTTLRFDAATGEPSRAVATLAHRGETTKTKTIAMDFESRRRPAAAMDVDARQGGGFAPSAPSKEGGQGLLASLYQTPSMMRSTAILDTPPSAVLKPQQLIPLLEHSFYRKNPSWMKTMPCQVCGKPLKTKLTYKCSICHAMCHESCRLQMPLPCVPLPPQGQYAPDDIRAHVSDKIPMLPVVLVHCVNEIERRGLDTLGLYRINGSTGKVEELYEKFAQSLKGGGFPPLCDAEMPVVCSLLKVFFKRLNDTLIPKDQFQAFADVCADVRAGECPDGLKQLVRALPRPNRDTLTYLMLHLKKIAGEDAVKMPAANLAKVFAPTIVGASSTSQMKASVSIMEALLAAPNEFYSEVLSEGLVGASCYRHSSFASIHTSGLGPIGGMGTNPRLRQLQQSAATKSRIFTSPYLVD